VDFCVQWFRQMFSVLGHRNVCNKTVILTINADAVLESLSRPGGPPADELVILHFNDVYNVESQDRCTTES
jgi:hypothetical protein